MNPVPAPNAPTDGASCKADTRAYITRHRTIIRAELKKAAVVRLIFLYVAMLYPEALRSQNSTECSFKPSTLEI